MLQSQLMKSMKITSAQANIPATSTPAKPSPEVRCFKRPQRAFERGKRWEKALQSTPRQSYKTLRRTIVTNKLTYLL